MRPNPNDNPTIEEESFVNVAEVADRLGCHAPTGIALLPRNFATAESLIDLEYGAHTLTIRSVWRQAGISESRIEPDEFVIPEINEQSFAEWVAPVIFLSHAVLSQHPELVEVALAAVIEYARNFFAHLPGPGHTRLEVIMEEADGACRRVKYRGPVEGLDRLPKIIKRTVDG